MPYFIIKPFYMCDVIQKEFKMYKINFTQKNINKK